MPASEICNRKIVIVQRGNAILEAARLMRRHHAGDVVAVEERGGAKIPAGIIADPGGGNHDASNRPGGHRRYHGDRTCHSQEKFRSVRNDQIYAL